MKFARLRLAAAALALAAWLGFLGYLALGHALRTAAPRFGERVFADDSSRSAIAFAGRARPVPE